MATNKFRNWQTILYLDSCKEGWEDIMKKHKEIKWYVSPLHDKDIKEDGENKKPHHHIVFMCKNQIRVPTFNEICKEIGALEFHSPKDNIVSDPQKAIEYHWHKNNPEKYQYNENDEIYINTGEYIPHVGTMVINYINDNKLWSINGIIKASMKDENTKIFDYVSKNTYFINQYLNDEVEKQKEQILQCVMRIISVIEDEPEIINEYALNNEYETLKEYIETE